MTRINLVPVRELKREHLIAEYRELPRVVTNVRKAIDKGKTTKDFEIPPKFVLGKGHMTFFYDKLGFLKSRQYWVVNECSRRGYKINYGIPYIETMLNGIPSEWCNDYSPTDEEIELSRSRIRERLGE